MIHDPRMCWENLQETRFLIPELVGKNYRTQLKLATTMIFMVFPFKNNIRRPPNQCAGTQYRAPWTPRYALPAVAVGASQRVALGGWLLDFQSFGSPQNMDSEALRQIRNDIVISRIGDLGPRNLFPTAASKVVEDFWSILDTFQCPLSALGHCKNRKLQKAHVGPPTQCLQGQVLWCILIHFDIWFGLNIEVHQHPTQG